MYQPWKVLPFNWGNTAPPFLVCMKFHRDSYEIHLTDLTYCWRESARREDIICRSQEHETSIDPSEDAKQMQLFLDKLRSAFTGGVHTGLEIKAVKSRERNAELDLSIQASAVLPRPLKPLLWPMHFELEPAREFTDRVTIPLFEAQNARLAEIEALLGTLKEKDHVIQKLADKLEASGTDLGQVFPGASGRGGRKISRHDAETRVKGLRAFDERVWRREMKDADHDGWENTDDLIGNGKMKFELGNTSCGEGQWFEWLEESKSAPLVSKYDEGPSETKVEHRPTPKGKIENESDGEDDLQVQTTPLRHRSPIKQDNKATNAENDDEDNLDGPSQRFVSQRSMIPDSVPIELSTQISSRPKKPGTIAGIQRSSVTRFPSPPPRRDAQSTEIAMDGDQDTTTEDESPAPPPPKPKKIGLGMIGGKKKEATPAVKATLPSPRDDVRESPAPEKKAKGKPSMIGHNAKEVTPTDGNGPRGRAQAKEVTPPPPRETSLERADCKRLELKRQLEEKAKAPVKRKRKF